MVAGSVCSTEHHRTIDESGDGNVGSDHNRLHLVFARKSRKREPPHVRRTRWPTEEELEKMAGKLEPCTQDMHTYEAIIAELRWMLRQLPPHTNGWRRPKALWNAKVAAAIARRQEVS